MFKQLDHELVPIFVAKELHKLPPVTFDHLDATRLLKDILVLQSELRIIKDTCATQDQFKDEVNHLKHTSYTNSNNFDQNINKIKRGGSGKMDSFCLDSGPLGLPHIIENTSPIRGSTPSQELSPKPTMTQRPVSPVIGAAQQRCVSAGTVIAAVVHSGASETEGQQQRIADSDVRPKSKTLAGIVSDCDNQEWNKKNNTEE